MSVFTKIKNKRTTIMRSLVIPLIIASVLQALVFYSALALSGTVRSINDRSEKLLEGNAAKCAISIETEMSRRWGDLTAVKSSAKSILDDISQENRLSAEELLKSDMYSEEFLSRISEKLLESMRVNFVGGSFIVLSPSSERPDENAGAELRGVFFTDANPAYNGGDYADIMMIRGSHSISEKYSVSLGFDWESKFRYIPGETEMNYFFRPVLAKHDHSYAASANLGYWSKPFSFSGDSSLTDAIITYSEPLVYDSIVIGSIGISVPVSIIEEFMPLDDIYENDGCYALISYEEGSSKAYVSAVSRTYNGFDQKKNGEILLFGSERSRLKRIDNIVINGAEAYCSVKEVSIYPENSPYGNEKWAVAAIEGRDKIYYESDKINLKLISALAVSAVLASLMVLFAAGRIVKPVKALSENVRSCGENGSIEPVETPISEISDLSSALSELSRKRVEYQNELAAERERYLIAVRSTNDNIIEYNCDTDVLSIYGFDSEFSNSLRVRTYDNFRKRIEDGEVCHTDSISDLMALLDGVVRKTGYYVQIRLKEKDLYVWQLIKSKGVYDSEGKLMRVIASSRNVTEEKKREEEMLDKERRDPVTGLYRSDYGNIIASRFSADRSGEPYILANVRITDMDKLFSVCGQAFCCAALEEAAEVIKSIVPKGYVVYKGRMDEFVILANTSSKSKARAVFRKISEGISGIYSGSNVRISCVIGAYVKPGSEPLADSKKRADFAADAAHCFNYEYGGIVFADEAADKTAAVNEFRQSEARSLDTLANFSGEESPEIVPFAFSILEKSSDFEAALQALISKAGRMLGMQRILILDMRKEYCTMRVSFQWNAPGMAPVIVKTYNYSKQRYSELEEKYSNKAICELPSDLFEKDAAREEFGKINADGTTFAVPMFESENISGLMIYQSAEEYSDDSTVSCMCELAKVIAAYISRSRTSRESRAKTEFLSKMSHEIRTPMNAIIGMTAIAMSSDKTSEFAMECLKKIDSSSRYLMTLINDILDMSRIESGKMTVCESFIDMNELIGGLDTMIRVQTENKGIWFRVEKEIPSPYLMGDKLKLNQVLVNILGNAVKFTPKGGITLRVIEKDSGRDGAKSVFFSVKDTGIGISKENLGRIFDRFEQADPDTTRKYGGTGLGLAISSNLVRLLGGTLEVSSTVGEGSEFRFTLTMKTTELPEKIDEQTDGSIDFTSKRILVVEDDDLNAEIAQTLIEDTGIVTERAANGLEAAEMFEKSSVGYYDAILMDIRMPVMDGIEATKRIRGGDKVDSMTVPIIAMSANAFDEDMKKSIDCGMNGHLSKPIDIKKIVSTFSRIWKN